MSVFLLVLYSYKKRHEHVSSSKCEQAREGEKKKALRKARRREESERETVENRGLHVQP